MKSCEINLNVPTNVLIVQRLQVLFGGPVHSLLLKAKWA